MIRNYERIYRIWLAVEIVILSLFGILSAVLSVIYYSKGLPIPLVISLVTQIIIIYGSFIFIKTMAKKTNRQNVSKWIYAELTCTAFTIIALGCVVIVSIGILFSDQISEGVGTGIGALILIKIFSIKFYIGYKAANILDTRRFDGEGVDLV
uniref:Uncharacterized protein n=1 Tax=Lepeophtheirus salmonis TaxID=72036 RepID=A0A0K2TXY5_LEPSM